eukprot:2974891-Rhodomonas_salina.1
MLSGNPCSLYGDAVNNLYGNARRFAGRKRISLQRTIVDFSALAGRNETQETAFLVRYVQKRWWFLVVDFGRHLRALEH